MFVPARRARDRFVIPVTLACLLILTPSLAGHEIENTHVLVGVFPDGTYQVDVLNDADWLWLQLHPGTEAENLPSVDQRDVDLGQLATALANGVTLVFDGVPTPPDMVAYLPPLERDRAAPMGFAEPGIMRLTGAVPAGSGAFQLRYDRVIDQFPMTVAPAVGAPVTRWLLAGQLSPVFDLGELSPLTRFQVALQYLQLGFTHIVPRGLDHILFVIGLFLLSTKFTPLLLQVTAFTAAHTITLALTIYGVVTLAPTVVEPLIALSIAYVAVENLVTTQLQPWRVALVFVFGLLHGMGFAGVLNDLGLPRSEFVTALLTFNVGVEVGQLTVIGVAFAMLARFRNQAWYRTRVVMPLSVVIGVIGLYWTVERVWLA